MLRVSPVVLLLALLSAAGVAGAVAYAQLGDTHTASGLIQAVPLCDDKDGLTYDQEAALGTDHCDADTDNDDCIDGREAQTSPGSQATGGLRNPLSFWDFYDVWTRPGPTYPWTRDKVVTVTGDIFAVARRFGANRPGGAPSPAEALTEALTPPTSDTGYHTDYDRGPLVRPNPWDMGPPDGYISVVVDVLGVARQFGHSCL